MIVVAAPVSDWSAIFLTDLKSLDVYLSVIIPIITPTIRPAIIETARLKPPKNCLLKIIAKTITITLATYVPVLRAL